MVLSAAPAKRARVRFKFTTPIVREPVLHKEIADVFRREIGPPGHISRDGVTWWSVDMAAYAGSVPGLRTGRGCIAGVPDLIVLHQGKAHFAEVKADDGVVSPAQQHVATAILIGGVKYGVVRNALEAIELLDEWAIPRAHRVHLSDAEGAA